MLVHKEFPEDVAMILNSLSAEELKKRIITENGLSMAQEEEILALDPSDTVGPMDADKVLEFLKQRRNAD